MPLQLITHHKSNKSKQLYNPTMFKFVIVSSVIASAVAFAPASRMLRVSPKISMSSEFLPGAVAPFGYFDPLSLSKGKTEGECRKIRESELKHGRVAMIAFIGMMVGESFNPLFDGKISGPAIFQFQQADDLVQYFWVGVLFFIALIEGQNILTGWESPEDTNARSAGKDNLKGAQLKEDYINGDLGFDPLGLTPADQDEFDDLRTKELNNGRLAMIGVAGIIGQELVNGKGVLENFIPV